MVNKNWVIKPTCPDEIFTNREDVLDFLWGKVIDTSRLRTISTAFIGLRRFGKSELFRRIFNKAYLEQDRVVPIYYNFQGKILVSSQFTPDYFFNFLRQYFGFLRKDRDITTGKSISGNPTAYFLELAKEEKDEGALEVIERYMAAESRGDEDEMLEMAIKGPKLVTDYNENFIIVFLDEFQDVLKIRRRDGIDPNAVGRYQEAVEVMNCPHVITGSALTLILKDILSRGALYGRFEIEYIRGLNPYFARDLVKKWARHYDVETTEEMTAEIALRTAGNPFYIRAIVSMAKELGLPLKTIEGTNSSLASDLIKGAIYSELSQQIRKFIQETNKFGLGKTLIYYVARDFDEEKGFLDLDDMEIIAKRAGSTLEEVRDMCYDLARADLIDEYEERERYGKVKDPILNEFLKEYTKMDKEKKPQDLVLSEKLAEYESRIEELKKQLSSKEGILSNYKGKTVEVYIRYLMTRWNNEEIDGWYFGRAEKVLLPKFIWIDSQSLKAAGTPSYEFDMIGVRARRGWIGESKYWEGKRIGVEQIKDFADKCEKVARAALNLKEMKIWYFSKDGFTEEAREYMQEQGILYSDEDSLNELLLYFGLERLPQM